MMDLVRYDPFIRNWPSRAVARWLSGPSFSRHFDGDDSPVTMRVDVAEEENAFVIQADVPGYSREDLKVEVEDGILNISAEHKEEKEEKNDHYHVRERCFGSFARSFSLPKNVDSDKIEATVKDGVLTVTVPKAEAMRPKQIDVKVH